MMPSTESVTVRCSSSGGERCPALASLVFDRFVGYRTTYLTCTTLCRHDGSTCDGVSGYFRGIQQGDDNVKCH